MLIKAKTRLTKVIIKSLSASRGDSTTIHSKNPSIASHLAENDWGVGWKMHSWPHEQVCLEGNGVWRPRGGLAYLPCTRIQGEEEAFSIRRCLTLPSFETYWPRNQVRFWFLLHTIPLVNIHQKRGNALRYYMGSDSGSGLSSRWNVGIQSQGLKKKIKVCGSVDMAMFACPNALMTPDI